MSELRKNLLKGTRACLLGGGALGGEITWQFCLEEKPIKATGSPCRAKGEKAVPLERVAFWKTENRSSHVRENLGDQKEMK